MVKMPEVKTDAILLEGGLDLVTPTLRLPNGYARDGLNFEVAINGGYSRIAGYERFDGHTSPSYASEYGMWRFVSVTSYSNTPAVGDALTTSGGATGTVAYVTGTSFVLTKITGTLTAGHTISRGATLIGTLDNVYVAPSTTKEVAQIKNYVADIYRAGISAVPGSGAIRGIVEFGDVVYAFRDNTLGTALDIYKSSSSGWTQVSLYKTVSFTAGGSTTPADGATLTQGSVTATIKRVVRTAGEWQGATAEGQFIITTPSGGNFASGAATIGSVSVTLSGAQTSITLQPGGKLSFVEYNFAGQAATNRIYGADGKNKCFEFDGDILVPISTGATTDTPSYVAAHKGYLFIAMGSSIMHSSPGLPYDWTALGGAAEIATGDTVTGIITLPGGTESATLGIYNRSNTLILYGSSTQDWELVAYNTGTGAIPFTPQNMSQTYTCDDRGIIAVKTSLSYGNFTSSTLSSAVLPFLNARIGRVTCATLCRRKSQYRLFFNDGYGIWATIVNDELKGCMTVFFPDPVYTVYEGKNSTGEDVIYFGSSDGMVYQMEKGSSFDGDEIPFYLSMNYATSKSARTLKRYRKAAFEITSDLSGAYAEFDVGYGLGYGSEEYTRPDFTEYTKSAGGTRWDAGLLWDTFSWDMQSFANMEIGLDGTAESISIAINGTSDYIVPFTISSILLHYSFRRMMR